MNMNLQYYKKTLKIKKTIRQQTLEFVYYFRKDKGQNECYIR